MKLNTKRTGALSKWGGGTRNTDNTQHPINRYADPEPNTGKFKTVIVLKSRMITCTLQ